MKGESYHASISYYKRFAIRQRLQKLFGSKLSFHLVIWMYISLFSQLSIGLLINFTIIVCLPFLLVRVAISAVHSA